MHIRDGSKTELVSNGKKSWIRNSRGDRISPKFKVKDKHEVGYFTVVTTNREAYIYHRHLDGIVAKLNTASVNFEQISNDLYKVDWKEVKAGQKVWLHRIYNRIGVQCLSECDRIRKFSCGMAAFRQNYKWGFIYETGEVALEPVWQDVSDFTESGYSVVEFRESDKKAVIDRKGSYVLPPREYTNLRFLTEDLLLARNESGYGVISISGKVIIPLAFSDISLVSGFLRVRWGRKYGLYDTKGNVIFECIYPEIIETHDKFFVHDFARKEVLKQKEALKNN